MELKFTFKDFSKAFREAQNQRNLGQKASVRHEEHTDEWGVYVQPRGV